jgi:hypothetical protein
MSAITLYHGAHRWEGPPEIRPAKSMKVIEHGPGLYLSTGIETALSYAKGGGAALQFEVKTPLVWAEDVRIPVSEMISFVEAMPRLRHRAKIIQDLRERSLGRERVLAPMLGNLLHYYGVAHGDVGVELVRFYLRHGIDADRVRGKGQRGDETWVVLYNLDKIVRYERVRRT